jgi:hypothetical protein
LILDFLVFSFLRLAVGQRDKPPESGNTFLFEGTGGARQFLDRF